MLDFLFAGEAAWFGVPAVAGTAVFVLRLVLSGFGADGLDAHAGDVTVDHHDGHSGEGFTLLSIQAIAAFLMGFGWGGLAALRASHLSLVWSALAGIAVGMAMVWVLAMLLKGAYSLQSSGNVGVQAAVGRKATVYAAVPRGRAGMGQVTVVIGEKQRTFDAVTEGDELPRGTNVVVVGANGDNTLTIAKA